MHPPFPASAEDHSRQYQSQTLVKIQAEMDPEEWFPPGTSGVELPLQDLTPCPRMVYWRVIDRCQIYRQGGFNRWNCTMVIFMETRTNPFIQARVDHFFKSKRLNKAERNVYWSHSPYRSHCDPYQDWQIMVTADVICWCALWKIDALTLHNYGCLDVLLEPTQYSGGDLLLL